MRPICGRTPGAGFTLLELSAVMTIIGLLAGYVGPKFFAHIGKSEIKAARAQIDGLEKALDQFRLDMECYPSTEEGLLALTEKPAAPGRWGEPHLKKAVPDDLLGQALRICSDSLNHELCKKTSLVVVVQFYNHQRPHQAQEMKIPAEAFALAALAVQDLLGKYNQPDLCPFARP